MKMCNASSNVTPLGCVLSCVDLWGMNVSGAVAIKKLGMVGSLSGWVGFSPVPFKLYFTLLKSFHSVGST